MNRSLACSRLLIITLLLPTLATPQVYNLADINTPLYQALDRDRTAVLLPLGVIEEHGPYLPILTDSYVTEWLAEEVAKSIVARDGWSALIMPSLPIGNGAPEDFGPRDRSLGSIPLRPATKRAVLMDLATGLGDAGFRWIFLFDFHGPAVNQRITDEASMYFEDTYGGTMLNLMGVTDPAAPAHSMPLSEEEKAEDGFGIHSGMRETSLMLNLRPDLVDPAYLDAPPVTVTNAEGFVTATNEPDWPGYFGSPRLASAERGAASMRARVKNYADLALRIIDGFDHRALERDADTNNPALRRVDEKIAERASRIEKQQSRWITENLEKKKD